MIASKVIASEILPYVITGIGSRIGSQGQQVDQGPTSRNPHSTNNRATSRLQPSSGYGSDDPRRQSNIDHMMEQRERNMRIREQTQQQSGYQAYGNSPFNQQSNEVVAQAEIAPIHTIPSIDPVPQVNNDRSAFDDQDDELDLDELHQHLIDNVNNGHHDDSLPLDNDSFDSIENQRRQPDRPPEYPNGGNYPNIPQVADFVNKIDKIASVVQAVIPKKKQDKKEVKKDKQSEVKNEKQNEERKDTKSIPNGAVDYHDIFKKTIVNKSMPVNTKKLL